MDGWRYAAVCLNGHEIQSYLERPHTEEKFCPTCGSPVVTTCAGCGTPIRGQYHVDGIIGLHSDYDPPSFCFNCGVPFPWTVTKLAAAKELTDELDGVSDDDKEKLKGALDDISREGPRSEVGAARIKKILKKTGTGVGNALYKIAVDVGSEAAKKILLGQ